MAGATKNKETLPSGKGKASKTGKSKKKSTRQASRRDKLDQELMETELSQAKSWLSDRASKVESEISQLAERLQIRRMLGKTRDSRETAFQEDLDSSLRIEGQGSPTRGTAQVSSSQQPRSSSPIRTSEGEQKHRASSTASPGKSRRGKQTSSADRSSESKHMSSLALREIAKQIKEGAIYEKLNSRELVFKEYTDTNKIPANKFDSALEKMHVKLEGGENGSKLLQVCLL